MATITENRDYWNQYDWSQAGDEWSSIWGGTDVLWHGCLWPRLRTNLPAGSLVEIAPGFGRITAFLLDHCERYVGIDVAATCVEACCDKFGHVTHADFREGDGVTLTDISDGSVDFVFSYDSLVHAEAEVLNAYTKEIARVLRPGGTAFLHHSNMRAFSDPATGILSIENKHWRGESMSAELLREFARDAGITCVAQEIINWGGADLTDCFSMLAATRPENFEETRVTENPRFMDEAASLGRAARVFDRGCR